MSGDAGASARSLVLNATFEPLGVVGGRRATILVLDGKAESVVDTSVVLHSERSEVAVPSVVRLRRFVRAPYRRHAPLNRRAIFARDEGECQYCGARAESIDHVIPRSRGGEHRWDNVVAACRRCNVNKRDRLLSEYPAMRLRRAPRPPDRLSWISLTVAPLPREWGQFLGAGEDAAAEALSA